MKICAYQGRSFFPSRIIEIINWSPYSHISCLNENTNTEIGAETQGVVEQVPCTGHKAGTQVDFFNIKGVTPQQEELIWLFLRSQKGKKYDFMALVHFLIRHDEDDATFQEKWFCSEVIFYALWQAMVHLMERIKAWKVYPGMIVTSPVLDYAYSVVLLDEKGGMGARFVDSKLVESFASMRSNSAKIDAYHRSVRQTIIAHVGATP